MAIDVQLLLKAEAKPSDRLIAVYDPLGLATLEDVKEALEGIVLLYENELSFRLEYEPFRCRRDAGEDLRISIVFPKNKSQPKDIQAKARQVSLAPSALLKGLHPAIDELVATKVDLEQLSSEARFAQLPLSPRSYQETVSLVLGALFSVPTHPSLEHVTAALWTLHFEHSHGITDTLATELGKRFSSLVGGDELAGSLVREEQTFRNWLEERVGESIVQMLGVSTTDKKVLNLGAEPLRRFLPLLEQKVSLASTTPLATGLEDHKLLDAIVKCPLPGFRNTLAHILAERVLNKGKVSKQLKERQALYASTGLEKAVRYLELTLTKAYPSDSSGWLQQGMELAEAELLLDQLAELGHRFRPRHHEWVYQLNLQFARFVAQDYPKWLHKPRPPMTLDILPDHVLPMVKAGRKVLFLVYDGMSYDHWLVVKPLVQELLGLEPQDRPVFAVVPTTTFYGRNAIFAGKFPREIARTHGPAWLQTNRHEGDLLKEQLRAVGVRGHYDIGYKWNRDDYDRVADQLKRGTPLVAAVSNFVDSLITAAPTARISNVELRRWVQDRFKDSFELQILRGAKDQGYAICITSDHGNTLVTKTIPIPGAGPGLKTSRYMALEQALPKPPQDTIVVRDPEQWGLPRSSSTQYYLLALGFLKFKDAPERDVEYVVHGGISVQEMVVPMVEIDDAR